MSADCVDKTGAYPAIMKYINNAADLITFLQ